MKKIVLLVLMVGCSGAHVPEHDAGLEDDAGNEPFDVPALVACELVDQRRLERSCDPVGCPFVPAEADCTGTSVQSCLHELDLGSSCGELRSALNTCAGIARCRR